MLRFSLDAIASFSHLPLQLATYVGLLSAGVAFIAIPVVIALRIAGSYLPGFGSITIAILLLGGIQLIALGVIGEYVGRIYDEVKHRPLYIVRDERNRPAGDPGEPAAATIAPTAGARGLHARARPSAWADSVPGGACTARRDRACAVPRHAACGMSAEGACALGRTAHAHVRDRPACGPVPCNHSAIRRSVSLDRVL